MKQHIKQFSCIAVASVLLATCATPCFVAAKAINTPKEEVIYVNLDGDGKVKNIDVVNIFNITNHEQIIDYGDYASVRNMTSTDQIDYADHVAKIKTSAQKIYYTGRNNSNESPWVVKVTYNLDSKDMNASEVAGKSGKLKITLNIARNQNYHGADFYKNYALQTSIAFDTEKVENIVSDEATFANVGQDKQLTFIALPNQGANYIITADVTDFETDGFSINALPLTLNIDIDDSELLSKVRELQDGIAKIDDGATALNGGLQTLKGGINKAQQLIDTNKGKIRQEDLKAAIIAARVALDKADLINEKSAEIIAASKKLQSGIDELVTYTEQLKGKTNYDTFDNYLKQHNIDNANLKQQNAASIEGLKKTIATLKTQIAALSEQGEDTSDLEAQIVNLEKVIAQLEKNNDNIDRFDNLAKSFISQLNDGVSKLNTSAKRLQQSYAKFDEGLKVFLRTVAQLSNLKHSIEDIVRSYERASGDKLTYETAVAKIVAGYNSIVSGTTQLANGGQMLSNGTHQLRTATSNLDVQVENKIADLLDGIKGKADVGSFTSSDNTRIEAVQFAIKTAKVAKPTEAKTDVIEQPKPGFWERFMNLFK